MFSSELFVVKGKKLREQQPQQNSSFLTHINTPTHTHTHPHTHTHTNSTRIHKHTNTQLTITTFFAPTFRNAWNQFDYENGDL
jgi:hypothetical protein